MRLKIPRYDGTVRGLPQSGKCIPFTNSEISRLACLRKHWFSYIEGLKQPETEALSIGNAWDAITQDIYLWWARKDAPYHESFLEACPWCKGTGEVHEGEGLAVYRQDCSHCDGTGYGPIKRAEVQWHSMLEDHDPPLIGDDDCERLCTLLRRMAIGYLHRWQNGPLDTLQIVAVQESVSRVVINPATGHPYAPDTYLRKLPDGYELATTADMLAEHRGEVELVRVNWPVYQIGMLDVLARDRKTSAGWVIDAKSTKQPSRFVGLMGVDPQLSGYCWLLEPHLDYYGLSGVAGFMYDIANTAMQRDPRELAWKPPKVADMRALCKERGIDTKPLKKSEDLQAALGIVPQHGGFSQSKSGEGLSVPSWRYEWAIQAARLDPDDYEEHLDWLYENVDSKFYGREWSSVGPVILNRYGREVYSKARLLADVRRRAVRVRTAEDLDDAFPRTPVCTYGGMGCGFTGICSQDSDEAREHYNEADALRWSTGAAPTQQADLGF